MKLYNEKRLPIRLVASISCVGAKLFAFPVLWLLLSAESAYAYIDPATGSVLFQLILAAFFSVIVALRVCRNKVTALFSSVFRRRTVAEDEQEESSEGES